MPQVQAHLIAAGIIQWKHSLLKVLHSPDPLSDTALTLMLYSLSASSSVRMIEVAKILTYTFSLWSYLVKLLPKPVLSIIGFIEKVRMVIFCIQDIYICIWHYPVCVQLVKRHSIYNIIIIFFEYFCYVLCKHII